MAYKTDTWLTKALRGKFDSPEELESRRRFNANMGLPDLGSAKPQQIPEQATPPIQPVAMAQQQPQGNAMGFQVDALRNNAPPIPQQQPQPAQQQAPMAPTYQGPTEEEMALRGEQNQSAAGSMAQNRFDTEDKWGADSILQMPLAGLMNLFTDEDEKVAGYKEQALRGMQIEQEMGDMVAQREATGEFDMERYKQLSQLHRQNENNAATMERQEQGQGDMENVVVTGPGGYRAQALQNKFSGEIVGADGEVIDMEGKFIQGSEGDNRTAAQKDYDTYMNLESPEEKQAFMAQSGALQTQDLGDRIAILDRVTGQEIGSIAKNLAPEKEVDYLTTVEEMQSGIALSEAEEKAEIETHQALTESQLQDQWDTNYANYEAHQPSWESIDMMEDMLDVSGERVVALNTLLDSAAQTSSGIGGALLKDIPGTFANQAEAMIGELTSRAAINEMIRLNQNGGGLAPVSDSDIELLKSAYQHINIDQSPAEIKRALENYLRLEQGVLRRSKERYGRTYGTQWNPVAPQMGVPSVDYENSTVNPGAIRTAVEAADAIVGGQ